MRKSFVTQSEMERHLVGIANVCAEMKSILQLVVMSPQHRQRKFYAALESDFGISCRPGGKSSLGVRALRWIFGYPMVLMDVPLEDAFAIISRLAEQSMVEVCLLPRRVEEQAQILNMENLREQSMFYYMVDEDSADYDGTAIEVIDIKEACPSQVKSRLLHILGIPGSAA